MGNEGAPRLVKQKKGQMEEMEKGNDLRLPEEDKDALAGRRCWALRKVCPWVPGEPGWSLVGG